MGIEKVPNQVIAPTIVVGAQYKKRRNQTAGRLTRKDLDKPDTVEGILGLPDNKFLDHKTKVELNMIKEKLKN